MAIAQGIFQAVAYKKETTWGVDPSPTTGATQLPRTALDLNTVKNTFQSNRIVGHQQSAGTRHGTERVEGSYQDEISCATHKDFWAALLRNAWVNGTASPAVPGHLFVPQTGHTRDSFTIEGWRSDITESRRFRGVRITGAQVSIQPNGMATVNFAMMGKDEAISTSRFYASPTVAPSNTPASGAVGEVKIDGVAVAVATSASFNIDGEGSVGETIGNKHSPDVFLGVLRVSGDVSIYHRDKAMLEKYLQEQTIALVFQLDEPGGTHFVRFSLPNVTITGYTVQDVAGAAVAQVQWTADMNEGGADPKAKSIILVEDTRVVA